MTTRPRVLFVGPTRYTLPLAPGLEQKWAALEAELDYRVLARGSGSEGRFELVERFYSALPWRVRRIVRRFRPQAVVAEDPRTGALVLAARAGVRVIVEVHGNWRHSTRLYGSPARRLLSPLVDALDVAGVKHADGVRGLSSYTARLVEEVRGKPPDAVFPTYSDLGAFTTYSVKPLPEQPTALFVGVLEPYKNIEGLAEAWRKVAPQVPGAKLVVVGAGSQRDAIEGRADEYFEQLAPEEVAAQLDAATVLVLPSHSEGLGRVVIEAFARGRGVVATSAGGILDLVEDGVQGLLVPEGDSDALAAALGRVLVDRRLAERLGGAARAGFEPWNQSPELFAQRMRALVDAVLD